MSENVDINRKIRPYIERIGNEYQRLSLSSCYLNVNSKDIDEQKSWVIDCLNNIDSLTEEIRIILERLES